MDSNRMLAGLLVGLLVGLTGLAGNAAAQERVGAGGVKPTAGIEAPARPASSLNYQRSPVQDSVLAGGNFGNLPGWSGTLPSPCEINPELTGCGGDAGGDPLDPCVANPAAPGCGGGGGGDDPLDPCVANPTAPGCDGGGGGDPPPLPLSFGGRYTATSTYSHDTAASIYLDITATSCSITTKALKSVPQQETVSCGALFASAADAAGYEIKLVADVQEISNASISFPSHTETTEWVSLGAISAEAETGHLIGATAYGSESSEVSGTYTVLVRHNGGVPQEVGVMEFALSAATL